MRLPLALLVSLGLIFAPGCGGAKEDDGVDTSGDSDDELVCGDDWVEKDPDAGAEDLQQTWGAPCTSNQDCVALLGFDDAECVTDILTLLAPPDGYCTRPCELPGADVSFVPDAADCDPDGGVTCLGAMGIFTVCALECTSDDQCSREGYGCIPMPVLAR